MKKASGLFAALLFLTSCANDGSSTAQKLDSLEQKIDTTLDKAWDSTKAKAEDLKAKVVEKWESRKDSAKRRDSIH